MANADPIDVSVASRDLLATEIVHSPGFSMNPRTDSHHEIFHVVRGGVDLECNGDRHRLAPGDHAVVPAGTVHRLVDVRPATLFLLALGCGVIDQDPDVREVWTSVATVSIHRPGATARRSLTTLWRTLLSLQRSPVGPRTRVRQHVAVSEILLLLDVNVADESQRSSRSRVGDFRRHLAATSHEPWTIDRAARACGVSVRRFTGLYREIHGTTFVPDLQSIRIDHVCELLSGGDHSVAGSAYSAGFEDLSHFYRVFNSRIGEPPGAWLERQNRR